MAEQEFITKEYFNKTLNKALGEHSRAILNAVSVGFEENKIDHEMFTQKIDKTWSTIDAYVKNQEDFRQKFVIMKAEIGSIKEIIKKKLGVEVRIK